MTSGPPESRPVTIRVHLYAYLDQGEDLPKALQAIGERYKLKRFRVLYEGKEISQEECPPKALVEDTLKIIVKQDFLG